VCRPDDCVLQTGMRNFHVGNTDLSDQTITRNVQIQIKKRLLQYKIVKIKIEKINVCKREKKKFAYYSFI